MAFLDGMDPVIRQRIVEDARYAPVLALLEAWNQETTEHLKNFEVNVVSQLTGEIGRKGDWRFPMQTLAVPEAPGKREVNPETRYQDTSADAFWSPCGSGWTLPTRIDRWEMRRRGWDEFVLVCDIHYENRKPDTRLLVEGSREDPVGQSQLAFVHGAEPIVAALAGAAWAIQHPGGAFEPMGASRYMGYLDFERSLSAVRPRQKQLDAWLPPFYPYGRKFLRFYTPAPEQTRQTWREDAWEWLGKSDSIRIAARVDERTADAFRAQADPPLILNAIPLAQMRTESAALVESPIRVGDAQGAPFLNKRGCFAATAYQEQKTDDGYRINYLPARLLLRACDDPLSKPGMQDADVICDSALGNIEQMRVRLHYDCHGEGATRPNVLSRSGSVRYRTPFPLLGGLNASIGGYEDTGTRREWYEAMLRSPHLTRGDLAETLARIPACRDHLDMMPGGIEIQLDLETSPQVEPTDWGSYLWPCLVSERALLEQQAGYLSKSRMAILPSMRLIVRSGRELLPAFLMEDLARYAASIISQYSMLGWYRVTGVVRT